MLLFSTEPIISFKKKSNQFFSNANLKKQASKVAHNLTFPNLFFSQSSQAHSQNLIFHITNLFPYLWQGSSVFVGTKIGSSCHSGQTPEFSLIPHCMLYVSDLNTGFSKLLSGLGLQVGFERFLSQNKMHLIL